jgi:nucleotide-binding universal stress UspA family protein
MTTRETILAATDYSESATFALRYAVDFARATSSELVLVHAELFTPPVGYPESGSSFYLDQLPELKKDAEAVLKSYATELIPADVVRECRVLVGPAPTMILRAAKEVQPAFVVVGTHGRTGIRRLFLGSVAEAVVSECKAPIVTVRQPQSFVPERERVIHRILCAVSANAEEEHVIRESLRLAGAFGAELVVAHVRTRSGVRRTRDDVTALLAASPVHSTYRELILGSEPAAQLVSYAREVEATLIVTAHDVEGVLSSRIVRDVIRHSFVPVLSMPVRQQSLTAAAPRRHDVTLLV